MAEFPIMAFSYVLRERGDAMMPLRAFVIWSEGFEPQPIIDVLEYQAPEPAWPNGRVLIVGRGECPLWADRAQVVIA